MLKIRFLVALYMLFTICIAHAQTFPTKTIRIVVPYSAGGASDIMMRTIATEITKNTGHTVIVENKPGAAGAIGTIEVARAPADGHTLLAGNNGTHVINGLLKRPAAYDAFKDFVPVALVQQAPLFIAVNPALGVENLQQLIALARRKPGGVSFASAGNAHTLGIAYLGLMAGVKFNIIPYKGPGPAQADTIAGHVDAFIDTGLSVLPHTRSGKLKLLAIASIKRAPNMPDVPAVSETFPGYEVVGTNALFAPSKTSPEVVAWLNNEVKKVVAMPRIQQMMLDGAGLPAQGDAEEVVKWMESSTKLWRNVMDKTGVVLE
jgi:tripartite-type tricarboxylate transporter receptor subunit TctC